MEDDLIFSSDLINRTRAMLKIFIDRSSFTHTNSTSMADDSGIHAIRSIQERQYSYTSHGKPFEHMVNELEEVSEQTRSLVISDLPPLTLRPDESRG